MRVSRKATAIVLPPLARKTVSLTDVFEFPRMISMPSTNIVLLPPAMVAMRSMPSVPISVSIRDTAMVLPTEPAALIRMTSSPALPTSDFRYPTDMVLPVVPASVMSPVPVVAPMIVSIDSTSMVPPRDVS